MKYIFFNFNFNLFFFLSFFLSGFLFLPPGMLFAAEISLAPESVSTAPESKVFLTVFLDTRNEIVNAVEGEIFLPAGTAAERAEDAGSIITVWMEPPSLSGGGQTIRFSGIIPGGFAGKGALFRILIKTSSSGGGKMRKIEIKQTRVLANDAQNTEVKTLSQDAEIFVSAAFPFRDEAKEREKDTVSPETFTPLISRDPNIFGNAWFVSFAAQDKGAGIASYAVAEMREVKKRDGKILSPEKESDWVPAGSPFRLSDQKRKSFVFVRAADWDGNFIVAILPPERAPLASAGSIVVPIFALLVLFALAFRWYDRKHKKSS